MINDLRKKTVDELKKIEEESRAELFALRFQLSVGNLEKPHRINELKKTVARILTVINEKLSLGETLTVKNIKIDLTKAMEKAEKATKTFKKEQDESEINVASTEQQQVAPSTKIILEGSQKDSNSTEASKPTKAKSAPTSSKQETKSVAKSTKIIVEEIKTKPSVSKVERASSKKIANKPTTKEATSLSNKKTSINNSKKDDEPFEESKLTSKEVKINSDQKEAELKNKQSVNSEKQSLKTIHEKVTTKIADENQSKVKSKVEKVQKPEKIKQVVELKSITDAKATFDAKEIEKIAKEKNKANKKVQEKGTLKDIKLNVKAKPKNTKAYTYGKQWHENSENIKEISQKRISKTLGKKKEVK